MLREERSLRCFFPQFLLFNLLLSKKQKAARGGGRCVCSGHLRGCEKILALRSAGGRDRRRVTNPESEER